MDELNQVIEAIERDTISGSSTLADNLIAALIKQEPLLTMSDKLIIIEKINELATKKPFFGVLKHLAGIIEKENGDWSALLTAYGEKFDQINLKISEQVISVLGSSRNIFLFHSNSKTIISVFESIPKNRVTKIFQTQSYPENEGFIQAKKLESYGFDVTVVDDDPAWSIFEEVDFFITGADLILPKYIINKSGTLKIAEKIRHLNKPYLVLADERKLSTLPVQTFPPSFERIPRMLISNLFTGETQPL